MRLAVESTLVKASLLTATRRWLADLALVSDSLRRIDARNGPGHLREALRSSRSLVGELELVADAIEALAQGGVEIGLEYPPTMEECCAALWDLLQPEFEHLGWRRSEDLVWEAPCPDGE